MLAKKGKSYSTTCFCIFRKEKHSPMVAISLRDLHPEGLFAMCSAQVEIST